MPPLGTGIYKTIVSAAEKHLSAGGHTSLGKALSSYELAVAVQKALGKNINAGTIRVYISRAAIRDESSRLRSGGPYGGYWYERRVKR
jgi:hypothetical protein